MIRRNHFQSFTNEESADSGFKTALISTFIFYCLANGYRFTHGEFAGDGLLMIYKNDAAWQVALGRFVQPLLPVLRGGISAPFLLCILCALWIGLSVAFITDYLNIRSKAGIVLTAGVCVCNITIPTANGAYLFMADFFTLALFTAVFGVWCTGKAIENSLAKTTGTGSEGGHKGVSSNSRLKTVLYLAVSTIMLMLSLGLYQSYICVALGLVILKFLFTYLPESAHSPVTVLKKALPYIFTLAAAAVIYYCSWKLAQHVFNVWTSDSYNGLAGVGDYSDTSIVSSFLETYRRVFDYFWNPEVFVTFSFHGRKLSIIWKWILRLCSAVSALIMVAGAFSGICTPSRRNKDGILGIFLCVLLLALFPFGINAVCFISKGMEHTLMVYAFQLLYIGAICGIRNLTPVRKAPGHTVLAAAILLTCWVQIIYANQMYLKLELFDHAAESILTRIVYEVEHMDGYIPGETPVAISGAFEQAPCFRQLEFYEEVNPHGIGKSLMPYVDTEYSYLRCLLGVNWNYTRVDPDDPDVSSMPLYPAAGSVRYVNGVIVVRISEL